MAGRPASIAGPVVAIPAAAAFLALGVLVAGAGPLPLDEEVASLVAELPVSRDAWLALAALGGRGVLLPLGLLVVGRLLLARRPGDVFVVVLVLVSSWLVTEIAKEVFARPRPPDAPPGLAGGFAYPSGHALHAAAVYGAVALVARHTAVPARIGRAAVVAAAICAVGVGVSRIALGVHWPSDVAGGWLAGVAIVAGLALVVRAPPWRGGRGSDTLAPAGAGERSAYSTRTTR